MGGVLSLRSCGSSSAALGQRDGCSFGVVKRRTWKGAVVGSGPSVVRQQSQVQQQQHQQQHQQQQQEESTFSESLHDLVVFDDEITTILFNYKVADIVVAVAQKYTKVMDYSIQSLKDFTRADHLELCGCYAPNISLIRYIARIIASFNRIYDKVNETANTGLQYLLIATIYVDRLLDIRPDFKLHVLNIHRVIFAAMIMAMKFTEDRCISVKCLSKIGGVDITQLNLIEKGFCKLMDFNFWIDPKTNMLDIANRLCGRSN